MPRKRLSENDIVLSSAAPAPSRRNVMPRRAKQPVAPVASPAPEPVSQAAVAAPAAAGYEPSREEIARLAYSYWESRGCQGGAPEEDWARAERELRARVPAIA